MHNPANQSDSDGEVDGLSKLDIVKHSMKAVIEMTKKTNNKTALISFSTGVEVISGFVETKSNHSYLNDKIDSLQPKNATNIWGALNSAIQLIKDSISDNGPGKYNIVLLTDGQENHSPSGGTINMLNQTILRSSLNITIDVIGIGYGTEIDSTFLQGIADTGSGSFVHVPSSEFMCDAFTRLTCNNSHTFGTFGTLNLKIQGNTFKDIMGYKSKKYKKISETEIKIKVNGLHYGVPLDIVANIKESPDATPDEHIEAEFKYLDFCTKNVETVVKVQNDLAVLDCLPDALTRDMYCEIIFDLLSRNIVYSGQLSPDESAEFIRKITAMPLSDYSSSIIEEFGDQVTKALSKWDWYQKWGQHYLISILEAHMNKVDKSFASKSMSFYSTPALKELFEEGSFIFNSLPPPSPSITVPTFSDGGGGCVFRSLSSNSVAPPVVVQKKPVNIKQYNTRKLDCFHGDCIVQTRCGYKKMRDLKKEDNVLTPFGYTKVKCLVHIKYQPHEKEMVFFNCRYGNGLIITKYHPIFDVTWKFPKDIGTTKTIICRELFNLVLENHHIVYVNNIECVTLGHGITANDIIMHEFFGTQKVIDCLKIANGWNEGKIIIDGEKSCSKLSQNGTVSDWIIVQ